MGTKKILIYKIIQVFIEYFQDIWSFLRYNGYSPFEPLDRRLSNKILIDAHTIEKGLTIPNPRPHFGGDKICALLDMAMQQGDSVQDDLPRKMLIGALRDYRDTFSDVPPPDPFLAARIDAFLDSSATANALGGVRIIADMTDVERSESVIAFLKARFSARNFGQRGLSDAEIASVISVAQRAPSQCNRQSVRVHVYRDRSRISKLLELQRGARGFIELVPTLFVVTSEITAWGGAEQRNQFYIDGGIYTMMLLLALEAHGFVSCPLNLALSNQNERVIKKFGDISASERLIVMIAAGSAPDEPLHVACSPRRSTDSITRLHD